MATITVYCSSNKDIPLVYQAVARETGRLIGERGHELVYGGSRLGLMGIVARSVQEHGGKVTGVIPKIFHHLAEGEDELILTEDLPERMKVMESMGNAFIALPGGFGTIQEMGGVLVAKQLHPFNEAAHMDQKPFVWINTNRFYNSLHNQLKRIFREGFAPKENRQTYYLAKNPAEAFDHIEHYKPPYLGAKTLARAEPD